MSDGRAAHGNFTQTSVPRNCLPFGLRAVARFLLCSKSWQSFFTVRTSTLCISSIGHCQPDKSPSEQTISLDRRTQSQAPIEPTLALQRSKARSLDMSKKTFLDLPAEVRVKIYRYYFGETKDEVSLHFDAACELVLPCRTTDHFDHLRIRAKRYGLTYQQMCSNPVISLLLTSHAVFQEALPSLYEHKIFNYGFDLKTLTPLRLTMKQRLKQLVLDGSVGASELVCLLEYKGEKDTDYLNDDLSVHSHLERFVGSNVGTTGL